ncbi:uncharacterized protein LOC143282504 [Babylonia areolata]|uniref:uncharacterized protein LOC143282504 n=1 Tax=Babylonia areolata TaxID=304850 RepID=UPI003FCFC0DE
MESNWTKVRQMVAGRVLSRHLQDLKDQRRAVEMAQEHHKRLMERELKKAASSTSTTTSSSSSSRDRADTLNPVSSRRQPPPTDPSWDSLMANDWPLVSLRFGRDAHSHTGSNRDHNDNNDDDDEDDDDDDDDDDLLDEMARTLRAAQSTEQQRPSLYRQPPADRPFPFTLTRERPLAASSKHQRAKVAATAMVTSSPRQHNGESFLESDQCQVLSLDGASPNPEDAARGKDTETTRQNEKKKKKQQQKKKKQKKNELETGGQKMDGGYTGSGAKYECARGGKVNVDFYDEDTGLKQGDDGGFTPKDLTLALDLLGDDEDDEDTGDDDYYLEEGGYLGKVVEEEEEEEEGDSWGEVKKCQYIRGYDPPQMRMPKDTVNFVFRDNA